MYQYRITKYDPNLRDSAGAFTQEQWTSYSDIGSSFENGTLTEQEYLRVESAYITSAINLLRESGINELTVSGLEQHDEPSSLHNGQSIQLSVISQYFQGVLRENYWCRFESNTGAFVHFGYDYYMYVGLPSNPGNGVKSAAELGLFVEPFASPYSQHDV